jgi:thiol peroxidase
MAQINFKGNPIDTAGDLPAVGSIAPDFTGTDASLKEVALSGIPGRKIVSVFPSVDTGVCATSVRTFTKRAAALDGVTVVHVSADLPFAFKRFCAAEGIDNAVTLSTFRSNFTQAYGLQMAGGPLRGLLSRAVLVLDADNRVLHAEQVPEVTQEPDYDAAIAAATRG